MTNFEGIRYFRPTSLTDVWGDPSKISRELLQKLDLFRDFLKSPVVVTSGYRPNSPGSQHALGLAVDVVAPKFTGSLFDLYATAERFNFQGIGIYPDWTYLGIKCGGLHLDVRQGKPARWMGIGKSDGRQYIALSLDNLKKYGVVK